MRIASLVPSATEMLFALGLGGDVVGVTHECDFPAAASELPHLTATVLPDVLKCIVRSWEHKPLEDILPRLIQFGLNCIE